MTTSGRELFFGNILSLLFFKNHYIITKVYAKGGVRFGSDISV